MFDWFIKKIYSQYTASTEQTIIYWWVFGLTFFLILFLSQTLFTWIFEEIGSLLQWVLLLIWSLGISSFLLFGNKITAFAHINKLANNFVPKKYLAKHKEDTEHIKEEPNNFHTSVDEEESSSIKLVTDLDEFDEIAHSKGALMSKDALLLILNFDKESVIVLEQVINLAKMEYPRFDGWIVLNKDQVINLLANRKYDKKTNFIENSVERVEEEGLYRENNVSIPINLPTGKPVSENDATAVGFIKHLFVGDEKELFIFMQKLRHETDENVRMFMREVIFLLDSVHRCRIDKDGAINETVLKCTAYFSNREIEEIMSILISCVDYQYDASSVGTKLTLLRALEYINEIKNK